MDEDNASIKRLIQGMTGGEVQLIQGAVISQSPLKISTDDKKLILNQNITIIPGRLSDIGVGDKLHVLSFAHGKQYYVLDKV